MGDPLKAVAKSSNEPSPTVADVGGTAPATKAIGEDAGKPAPQGGKFAPIKLMAGFEDLPGATTTGFNESSSHNALWLDTTLSSTKPMGGAGAEHFGVSRGQGTMIGTFVAPLADTMPAEGTGEIATRLFYGSELAQSFSVSVTGIDAKHAKQAAADARALTVQQIRHQGDVSVIEATVAAALAERYPTGSDSSIHVTIAPSTNAKVVTDAGLRKLYYKVGGPTSIVMEVKSVPAGKAEIQANNASDETAGGGAQYTGHSDHEHDDKTATAIHTHVDGHSEQSVDKMDVESTENLIKTENSFVTSFKNTVDDLKNSLIEKAKKDADVHAKNHNVTDSKTGAFDDYSNKRATTKDEGDKVDRNWASYLQSIVGIGKEVAKGPGGIGTVENPEISWGLDVAEKGLAQFAVKGLIHYIDKHDDTDVHDKRGSDGHVDSNGSADGDSHEKSDRKSDLAGAITASASALESRMDFAVTNDTKSYHSTGTKTGSGNHGAVDTQASHNTDDKVNSSGDANIDTTRSKTTHIQYNVSKTQTYLRPQLDVTVTEGDGQVASAPFGAKAGNP